MVYNLFPDFQDVNSWRRRGRILLFGVFKNKDSKDIKNQLEKQGCGPCPSPSTLNLVLTPEPRFLGIPLRWSALAPVLCWDCVTPRGRLPEGPCPCTSSASVCSCKSR